MKSFPLSEDDPGAPAAWESPELGHSDTIGDGSASAWEQFLSLEA